MNPLFKKKDGREQLAQSVWQQYKKLLEMAKFQVLVPLVRWCNARR
jgi:hypothetical protein